jgi:phosphatidylglycerophosphatase C
MEIVSRAVLVHRIRDAAKKLPGGALAFDGDGTLWSGDVGDDLWAAACTRGDFRPRATEAMRNEARAAGLDADGDVVAALNTAYETHRLPEERMYEIVTWAFAGWTRAELAAFCREVLSARGLAARLHPEVVACLRWARDEGLRVLVVSASPRAVVEEAVHSLGVGTLEVLAATPRWDPDVMRPEVERPIPYGPGKVHAIRGAIGTSALYAAFGDNAFDVAMLSEACVPVAVRPKDRLRARAAEVAALVELAAE